MSPRSAWMFAVVGGLWLVAGCGGSEEEELDSFLATARQRLVAGCTTSGVDGDADALDDGLESCLLQRHAPVLYLPWSLDGAKPANVDWYLSRVHMRFHHDGCPDCQVLALGSVTQASLINRSHSEKDWLCAHAGTTRYSYGDGFNASETFFLQPPDDTVHNGSTNPADWKVYGHVYKNALGGVNVQYWYFFPYNDGPSGFNHESDWEHINVRLAADYSVSGVHFAHHSNVTYYPKAEVQWHGTTHPVVWVADGSHASYKSEALCDSTIEEAAARRTAATGGSPGRAARARRRASRAAASSTWVRRPGRSMASSSSSTTRAGARLVTPPTPTVFAPRPSRATGCATREVGGRLG